MAVTVPASTSLWDGVLEMTKSAQSKGADPLMWAVELSSSLLSAGVSMPSTKVAELLVSHICWSNNVPIAWKFLEKALSIRIVPPMLVLALLSNRVIPSRRSHPAAYRLYLELLKRHIFPLASEINGPNYHKIMESINDALHLYQKFGLESSEPGIILVEFIFSVVWQLLDASLDDENLLELVPDKKSIWPIKSLEMEIDDFGEKKTDSHSHQGLYKMNTTMAIEIIVQLFRNKATSRILNLARQNMSAHWMSFIHHLRLLVANSTAVRNSKDIIPEALLQLTSDNPVQLSRECKGKTISLQQFHAIAACGSLISSAGQSHGASRSAIWLPIDLFLEDTMDGYVVAATSASETLTDLLKAHQAITQASWQDTFLGLWIAALRLVQREGEAVEGPVPRLDTCLCLLLCTTTLAVVNIIEEEENALLQEDDDKHPHQGSETQILGNCRKSLVSSLQQLGDLEGLLTPPPSVTSIANQAAAKAIMFFSGIPVGSGYLDGVSFNDMPVNCAGNLRHLIVEACIARSLLDTSAYLWPGYVKGHSNQIPRAVSGQMPGWSSLMKGSPLTTQMMHTLVSIPASSLAEIEKIYGIAINGSDEEKISAATVLCGASLTRGWNIQEHIGSFIIKLLAPPVPVDYSGSESHLIVYAPMLNVLLVGISSIDCVQIISLHGLAPHLAGVLMPICEVFGSCSPTVSWTLPTGEHLCPLAVFSNAFTLLLKLWRFHQPPLEHVMGDVTPVGSQLTPEFLLLARNSQLASCVNSLDPKNRRGIFGRSNLSSLEPIFLDSFPKLAFWYKQHQACIASTLSDLKPGTSVYQIFDALLNMMFRKMNRGGQCTSTSGSSSSSGSIPEDCTLRLKLPAWDILEAVPFVLDAALTACAHGRLSPRELTTGLKDLVQLGDILDRGEDEIAILSLLRSLQIQAKEHGGAVFQVNGNHETMNIEGDFRYVDSGAFDECSDFLEYLDDCEHNWEDAFSSWGQVSESWKEERKLAQSSWGPWNLVKRQKGVIARSVLLRPGGPLASELARHPVVLKVDDWVFCHGGLLPHHVTYGIEKINNEVSKWMNNVGEDDESQIPFIATRGYDSVVWNRLYSRDTTDLEDYHIEQIQSILDTTLQVVGAKAMVVGHTPQTTGVNCKYNCSIWRIDVGMSSGVLDSRPEVLEIRGDKTRVIRSESETFNELQAVDYM